MGRLLDDGAHRSCHTRGIGEQEPKASTFATCFPMLAQVESPVNSTGAYRNSQPDLQRIPLSTDLRGRNRPECNERECRSKACKNVTKFTFQQKSRSFYKAEGKCF